MKKRFLKTSLIVIAGCGILAGSAMADSLSIDTDITSNGTSLDPLSGDTSGLFTYLTPLNSSIAIITGTLTYPNTWAVANPTYSSPKEQATLYQTLPETTSPDLHLNVVLAAHNTTTEDYVFDVGGYNVKDSDDVVTLSLGGNTSGVGSQTMYVYAEQTKDNGQDTYTLLGIAYDNTGSNESFTFSLGDLRGDYRLVGIDAVQSLDGEGISADDTFNPVPEPVSMVLFGTGLLGFAGLVRRKKNT